MSEAIEVLKREIARRVAEVEVLQKALAALSGNMIAEVSERLMLPAPKGKPAKKRSPSAAARTTATSAFDVNGREITLGPKMADGARKRVESLWLNSTAVDRLPTRQLIEASA